MILQFDFFNARNVCSNTSLKHYDRLIGKKLTGPFLALGQYHSSVFSTDRVMSKPIDGIATRWRDRSNVRRNGRYKVVLDKLLNISIALGRVRRFGLELPFQ